MGRRAHECGEVTDRDVWAEDRNGNPVKIGSIVEIVEWSSDRYKGLFYVVAFEVCPDRGVRFLLSGDRWGKWDFKVNAARVSLRCLNPTRGKGE